MKVDVSKISNGTRLRAVKTEQVEAIIGSIAEVGLLNPITVYPRKVISAGISEDGYGVVAGSHRLAAVKQLGWDEVEVNVVELSDLQRQIAECDENLCGTKLTPSETALFTARRKDAYLALHPETAAGVAGANASNIAQGKDAVDKLSVASFADDQAAKTGQSSRNVRRDAARGDAITDSALDMVKGTPLDKGTYLDKLKRVPQDEQEARVASDLRDRASRSQADTNAAKIQSDVRARAANEVAEMIAEYIPTDAWDGVKANLYSAGANNIANALANITGQSIMDRGNS